MIVLTKDELRELTQRNRRDAQVCVLRHMGIEHRIRPDGTVVVLRAHVDAVLGGVDTPRIKARPEPDWTAL